MPIPGISSPAVPYGEVVVVSGATGFIGSHIADQLLAAGYKVRGTTRSVQKGAWVEELFHRKYGPGNLELKEVPDMAAEGAFDDVVDGAAGFIHVANDMSKKADADTAILMARNGALNALTASARFGVRRFVYTSSSFAATQPKPEEVFTITADTYNEEAIRRASEPYPDGETIYAASKVAAERAIWKWVEENPSSMVVNTVLPNGNIGPILSAKHQGYPTSASWVKVLWDRDYASLRGTPPQHFVNVQDDARLHVIALANPAVQNERIFAITGPVNLDDIVKILRKLSPEHHWEDFPDKQRDLSTFQPAKRAEQLHLDAYGVGFINLEDSVRGNAADLIG